MMCVLAGAGGRCRNYTLMMKIERSTELVACGCRGKPGRGKAIVAEMGEVANALGVINQAYVDC